MTSGLKRYVSPSDEWTETTRVQIHRTRLPEGLKCVEGSPQEYRPHLARTIFGRKLGRNYPRDTGKTKLQSGKMSVPNCKQLATTEESSRV